MGFMKVLKGPKRGTVVLTTGELTEEGFLVTTDNLSFPPNYLAELTEEEAKSCIEVTEIKL